MKPLNRYLCDCPISISLSHYDRIINYLLIFKYDANSTNPTIDRIIDKIIDNLKGRGEKFTQKSHLFASTLEIQNEEGARKFNEIKAKVFEALAYVPNTNSLLSLNYAETISKISNEDITPENFNKLMEILSFDDLIQNIVEFTSETMDNLRHIFLSINYTQLTADSLSIIQTFKNKINNLLTSNTSENEKLDCIQKLQLRWTVYAIEREIDNN